MIPPSPFSTLNSCCAVSVDSLFHLPEGRRESECCEGNDCQTGDERGDWDLGASTHFQRAEYQRRAIGGFFGVGGGFIVVPMLVLALGFPMKEASGTSLLVMIIASGAGLAARVGTHSNVDWPVVLAFAAASMVGGLLGGPLTKRASAAALTTVFGVLLLGVCAVTAYDLLPA